MPRLSKLHVTRVRAVSGALWHGNVRLGGPILISRDLSWLKPIDKVKLLIGPKQAVVEHSSYLWRHLFLGNNLEYPSPTLTRTLEVTHAGWLACCSHCGR